MRTKFWVWFVELFHWSWRLRQHLCNCFIRSFGLLCSGLLRTPNEKRGFEDNIACFMLQRLTAGRLFQWLMSVWLYDFKFANQQKSFFLWVYRNKYYTFRYLLYYLIYQQKIELGFTFCLHWISSYMYTTLYLSVSLIVNPYY